MLFHREEYLAVAADKFGVMILDVRITANTSLPYVHKVVAAVNKAASLVDLRIRITPDLNYLYILDMYYGVFVISLKEIYTASAGSVVDPPLIGKFPLEGVMYGMEISKDGNYLLVS